MMENGLLKILISSFLGIILSTTTMYAATISTVSNEVATEKVDKIKHLYLESVFSIKDLKSIEELADVIIKAEVLPERENVELLEDTYGFTKTKLKVTKVYSGNLKVNDIITLSEEYFQYTDNKTGEIRLQSVNAYKPTIIGKEYIFFLFDRGELGTVRENVYEIVNITDGIFLVCKEPLITQKNRKNSNIELSIDNKSISTYEKIYNEVIKKYK